MAKKERPKMWMNKTESFKAAEKFERDYYFKMSSSERLETVQYLRELNFKIKRIDNEGRKRLRRVIKIIK